uniref:Cardiac-enriched FHL2-interacting protein n=1 Tax=Pogona vitticeps TaxID=103695 RepID=A0ABM5FZY6_9SAUR
MQGNKKQTDGQSDSSSIGSLLDDTDREVCSLTDRAFKSLCVAEFETSYTESDPVVSVNNPRHFSSKFFHGPRNYVVRENVDSNKQRSKTEEHSTFQQFPKDSRDNEKASTDNTPNIRRKLGLPMSALRSNKHTSKVSSLIKTFDKTEKQPSLEVAKQPVKNSLTEHPLVFGGNMALWGGKAILNIQKELSGFADTRQDMADASSRHGIHKRHNKMDLVCQGPYSFYFSQADNPKSHISPLSRKTVKNRTGKAKEPTRRGNFLHSENSAFESWNAHHKKLAEVGDMDEILSKGKHLTYFEEAPFFLQSSVPECKLFPQNFAPPKILKQDISNDVSQTSEAPLSPAALPQLLASKVKSDSQVMLRHTSDLPAQVYEIPTSPRLTSDVPFPPALNPPAVPSPVPISKAPISPPPPQTCVPLVATSYGPKTQTLVPEVTYLPQKANSSEFNPGVENVCPPWRKQKTTLMGMGLAQDMATEGLKTRDTSNRKPSDLTSLVETTTVDSQVALSDPSSSHFNISKLLTPVIPPKQEKEPPEDPLLLINPSQSETGAARESEEKAAYSSQNNYKSKAPSLLFNLKDIRKRVKSTYSPSPLLRALEGKKKIKELDNMKANVRAVNMLEEDSEKLLDNDERSHQPSEQMDNIQEKDSATNINGNYLTWSAPKSKEDAQHYQNRHSLWQGNSVDVGNSEMVSVTELHPDENNGSLSSNYHSADVTMDQEVYAHSLHLQGPKNEKTDLNQNSHIESQVSPSLFFTAEENIINNENQACSLTGNEHKRSTSSSEHSFVSIIDQPYQNEASYSLMQLFQKACLQESQRKENDMSREEKLSGEEAEKTERKQELDSYLLNDYGSDTEEMYEKKEEQSEHGNEVQRTVGENNKEDGWKSTDSVTEDRSEEPLTPTSSNSFKPNLFVIKDNTFKSSPVIKAVKLPLLRSVSCEDFTAVSHNGTEKQVFGSIRATPNIQEMDFSTSRINNQQDTSRVAMESEVVESSSFPVNVGSQVVKKGNQTAEYTLTEKQGSFYVQELVGDDGRASITSVLSQKELEGGEKLTKAKEEARAGKPKKNSVSQPDCGLENDLGQNKRPSPTREKTSYFKNDAFSKRRDGSCVKKIISQEMGSGLSSENQTSSPTSSDAFGHMSAASGNLASSALPSPRPDSMGPSTFTSPSPDATATSNVSQAEKIANSSLPQRATESGPEPTAMETANPVETSQHAGDASNSPVSSGRQQLMGRMVKTAAKPPAVPPKTEKALRRAKKLASKRKKIEAQQKKPQDESTPHCTDMGHSQLVQSPRSSPVCPNSPLIPSESNLRLKPRPLLSPTPSLPETQRKLLQDPDSGEYFIIDLPIQLKTFYDPETGRYVQVSIPPSQRNVSHIPSSRVSPSAFALCPNTLPLRVSSVPVLASPSQFSESASFMQGTLSTSDWQPEDQYPESQSGQPCIESAVSDGYTQDADRIERSFGKDGSPSANADIISTGAIEDFAVEGIL